jgi:lipopolysaccharide/colanic/teichoic acid biosynthesis glycosyltransferase
MQNAQLELETPRAMSATVADETAAAKRSHDIVKSAEDKKNIAFSLLQARNTPWWKRCADISISLILLIVLTPLLLLIAGWIRFVAKESPIFKQQRTGMMGRDFMIYKFRTLRHCPMATLHHRQFLVSRTGSGLAFNKPNLSGRLIPGGQFLRKSSLDELPQLVNILRGDMSLIGPRPDVLNWSDYQPEQLKRFCVLPGVTGLWQVSGKNRLTFEQAIEKDIEYVYRRSMWLDLLIAVRTIGLLIKRDNH